MLKTHSLLEADAPLYQCHKQVRAVQIIGIQGTILFTHAPGLGSFEVDQAYIDKHQPQIGGYYVEYADGYQSFSPAQAFEEGYSPVEDLSPGQAAVCNALSIPQYAYRRQAKDGVAIFGDWTKFTEEQRDVSVALAHLMAGKLTEVNFFVGDSGKLCGHLEFNGYRTSLFVEDIPGNLQHGTDQLSVAKLMENHKKPKIVTQLHPPAEK